MADSPQKKKSPRTPWTWVHPVPEGTPDPRFVHYARGRPIEVYPYRTFAGELLGYSCLFPKDSGGTEILSLIWCRNADNEFAWRWQQFGGGFNDELRPLYGLDAFAETPDAYVLLVFDECSAEHARRIFPEFVPISFPGSFRKSGLVDWSPLKSASSVAIWPDHGAQPFRAAKGDPQAGQVMPLERQPAFRAAHSIAATLRSLGIMVWSIFHAREGDSPLPDGWNIARAKADGWSDQLIRDWYDGHLGNARPPDRFKIAPAEPALEAPHEPRTPSSSASPSTPSTGSAAAGDDAEPDDVAWHDTLLRKDGTGPLLPELFNVRTFLSNHRDWRGVIYLDEFAQRVMKAKPPPFDGAEEGEWSDTDDSQAHEWLSAQAGILKIRTSTVAQAVQTVAKLNGRNPLVERLRSLKWDGAPRLDTWLRTYLGALPGPNATVADMERLDGYLGLVGRKWLLGAVARAFVPGIKFDYVLVLEGQQGLGKSSAFAIIGGQWAMDTPFSLSDKEGMENIRGKWIVELAELDAFNKAESTTAKSFFSRVTDRFRLPYGKRSADFKRACVFGGTT
ncbi:MAG TPA: VapE domain-containing protein, partial [Burkholderiales bacterium]|nr:VapE domain-containing protein [Burkholderiales bacterium]